MFDLSKRGRGFCSHEVLWAPHEINETERVRYTGVFRYLYTGVFRTEVFVYVVAFIFIFYNVFYLN